MPPQHSVERHETEPALRTKKGNNAQDGFVKSQAQTSIQSPAEPPFQLLPSKKEMAKKRSFGEVVDLTQDLSDEDDGFRRVLKARLDKDISSSIPTTSAIEVPKSTDEPGASKARSVSPTVAFENDLRKKLLKNLEGTKSGPSSSAATDDEGVEAAHFKYTPLQRSLLRSETIIRRIDKRHDALRRSTYNPKTIARDILVASGKHPSMTPLNFHLNILRKKFRYVDYNSDLGTFRWDLVDPGGPEEGSLNDHNVDLNDADDEGMGAEVQRAELSVRPPVVASVGGDGVNILRPVDAVQTKWKAPRHSVNGVRRMVAGVTDSPQLMPQSYISEDGMMTFSRASNDTLVRNTSLAATGPIYKSPRGRPRKKPKPGDTDTGTPKQDLTPGPRRRGRPPSSKNKTTPKSEVSGNSVLIPTRSKPSDTTAPTPSKLRNAMTPSDGIAVVIGTGPPTAPGSSVEKKRKTGSRQPSTLRHTIYKCGWKGCPSELHNLDTLRKHVYKHRDQ